MSANAWAALILQPQQLSCSSTSEARLRSHRAVPSASKVTSDGNALTTHRPTSGTSRFGLTRSALSPTRDDGYNSETRIITGKRRSAPTPPAPFRRRTERSVASRCGELVARPTCPYDRRRADVTSRCYEHTPVELG